MIDVSQKAAEKITEFLKNQQGPSTVRILSQSCCGPASLAMALDEPQENDVIITEQDITFAIDKDLLEKAKPIRLDFVEAGGKSGFQLTSNLPAEGGGSGCCS